MTLKKHTPGPLGQSTIQGEELLKTLEKIIKEIDTTPDELSEALLGIIKIMARKAIAKALKGGK